ncbi:MAG: YbhB/YbcL family Raf kinase inhibitor-like protein [Candidatus Ranarchaeia archaeon]
MKLTSPDFENNGPIPPEYTCDGKDVSPELTWQNPPSETKSFALSCIDPDAPRGDFIHWLICNIPPSTRTLKRGASPPGLEIENDFGKTRYGGPCPPSGTHRYFFTVYALNVERLEKITKYNFLDTIKKHTIDKAVLMGTYKRR